MIQSKSTKLKRGVELSLNGTSVWVELDSGGDCVFVCWQKTRDVTKGDVFEWVVREELKPEAKARQGIQAKPKTLSKDEKVSKSGLNDFFDLMADKIPFNCQECFKPLYAHNKFAKRAVCCHIIPKSLFPTVATVEDNILFMGCDLLGVCNCHSIFDSNIENRIKMKIYPTALRQFNKFRHLLTDKELIKACKYLNIT